VLFVLLVHARPSGGYRITGEVSIIGVIAAPVAPDGTLAMVAPEGVGTMWHSSFRVVA
jgi:hypothetical protein